MNVIKTCPYCGKEFETDNPRQTYCTKSHGTLDYLRRNPKTRTCVVCGEKFTSTTQERACPSCREEHKRQTTEKQRQKWLNQHDECLCFSCARAYAKPYKSGGCERFFSNVVCYNRADYWSYENQGRLYVCISVTDCDLYVRGRRIENQKET